MKLVVVLTTLALSGCASNKRFVADATTARMYHFDRYTRACVDTKGPPTCKEMQLVLNGLLRDGPGGEKVGLVPLANQVQQVGEIPKMERVELKALIKRLEELP